jgi:hypothetical protein
VFLGTALCLFSKQRCDFIAIKTVADDVRQAIRWAQDGMAVPIDSVFPVRDLRAAIERQLRGGMRGKIVVDVEGAFDA